MSEANTRTYSIDNLFIQNFEKAINGIYRGENFFSDLLGVIKNNKNLFVTEGGEILVGQQVVILCSEVKKIFIKVLKAEKVDHMDKPKILFNFIGNNLYIDGFDQKSCHKDLMCEIDQAIEKVLSKGPYINLNAEDVILNKYMDKQSFSMVELEVLKLLLASDTIEPEEIVKKIWPSEVLTPFVVTNRVSQLMTKLNSNIKQQTYSRNEVEKNRKQYSITST